MLSLAEQEAKACFAYKSSKLKSAECKINQSLQKYDNGAGSKGLFYVKCH